MFLALTREHIAALKFGAVTKTIIFEAYEYKKAFL
jgi:hypothetical protein